MDSAAAGAAVATRASPQAASTTRRTPSGQPRSDRSLPVIACTTTSMVIAQSQNVQAQSTTAAALVRTESKGTPVRTAVLLYCR